MNFSRFYKPEEGEPISVGFLRTVHKHFVFLRGPYAVGRISMIRLWVRFWGFFVGGFLFSVLFFKGLFQKRLVALAAVIARHLTTGCGKIVICMAFFYYRIHDPDRQSGTQHYFQQCVQQVLRLGEQGPEVHNSTIAQRGVGHKGNLAA